MPEAGCYLGVAHGLQPPDLVDLGVDELLAAESGVDAHDKHQVHNLNHLRMRNLAFNDYQEWLTKILMADDIVS